MNAPFCGNTFRCASALQILISHVAVRNTTRRHFSRGSHFSRQGLDAQYSIANDAIVLGAERQIEVHRSSVCGVGSNGRSGKLSQIESRTLSALDQRLNNDYARYG